MRYRITKACFVCAATGRRHSVRLDLPTDDIEAARRETARRYRATAVCLTYEEEEEGGES